MYTTFYELLDQFKRKIEQGMLRKLLFPENRIIQENPITTRVKANTEEEEWNTQESQYSQTHYVAVILPVYNMVKRSRTQSKRDTCIHY